jgi:hypothetical protein
LRAARLLLETRAQCGETVGVELLVLAHDFSFAFRLFVTVSAASGFDLRVLGDEVLGHPFLV